MEASTDKPVDVDRPSSAWRIHFRKTPPMKDAEMRRKSESLNSELLVDAAKRSWMVFVDEKVVVVVAVVVLVAVYAVVVIAVVVIAVAVFALVAFCWLLHFSPFPNCPVY